MNWLDKLERRFPRFGIQNITMYLVVCNVAGYLLARIAPVILAGLTFDMSAILHGQIWRLVTWVLVPSSGSFWMSVIFMLCAVSWGKSLEQMLGTFRMTVFVIGAIIISDIGGILYYAVSYLLSAQMGIYAGVSMPLTTYYIILSILMEIALLFPDGIVQLWFILPIKMKWMFYFTLAELGYEIVRYFYLSIAFYGKGTGGIFYAILRGIGFSGAILLALLNLLVFYLASKNHVSHRHKRIQKEFQQQFRQAAPRPGSNIAKHKCCICGRTELTNPELLFRYCSKCSGNYEYCSDHLYNHAHK